MRCPPVTVQLGPHFVVFTVHFNYFCVEVKGVVEIILIELLVALIPVNLCNCYSITDYHKVSMHLSVTIYSCDNRTEKDNVNRK